MKNKKVVMLADVQRDSFLWSPKELFISALEDVENEFKHIKKAIIIYYDEAQPDNRNRIRWSQCGMRRSEVLNLLSIAHNDLIMDMLDEV